MCVSAGALRLFRRYVVRLVLRPGDSEEIVRRKELLVFVHCFLTVVCVYVILIGSQVINLFRFGMFAAVLVVVVDHVTMHFLPFDWTVIIFLSLFPPVLLLIDYGLMVEGVQGTWSIMVVMIDLALVLSAPKKLTVGLVTTTTLYILFTAVDSSMLGTTGKVRDIDSFGYISDVPPFCDCADPPCTIPARNAFSIASTGMIVFLVDFTLTRGFAHGLRKQVAMMQSAVAVSERVAVLLSRYQVEQAKRAVHEGGLLLPDELRQAYQQLLENLEGYLPYLPQSCLPHELDEKDLSTDGRSSEAPSTPPRRSAFGPTTPSVPQLTVPVAEQPQISPQSTGSEPRVRDVTVMATNCAGFLHYAAAAAPKDVASGLASVIQQFESAVKASSGVVDLLSADHLFASFNAARPLASHRIIGLQCMESWLALPCELPRRSGALISTRALCGDFGTLTSKRYMIVHKKCSLLHMLERYGTLHGIPIVVDATIEADVSWKWLMRLRDFLVYPRKFGSDMLPAWEAISERNKAREVDGEWMYELDALETNPWDPINRATEKWLRDGEEVAAKMVLEGVMDNPRSSCMEVAAAEILLHRIRAGYTARVLVEGTIPTELEEMQACSQVSSSKPA
eukprot:TRINITY_DN36960_c0_g1_i1.p1 TRINITY_DN36960_c0_g1~~TRINITY_DN36960_c0_g1_i1.p1  ORF type:complete len:622 (+),score=94.32 TRINITY_DN36960_c0_g1_i1:47-1912(+)